MNILFTQISVCIILWSGTIFFGTIPAVIAYYLSNRGHPNFRNDRDDGHQNKTIISKASILSLLMCFGGGILLATCFVHLIPEVRQSFEKFPSSDDDRNSTSKNCDDPEVFPMAEFVICCGFFIIYFVEEVIHGCINRSHNHSPPSGLPQVTTCHHSRRNSLTLNSNDHNIEYEDIDAVRETLIPKNVNVDKNEHCAAYGSTSIACNNTEHMTPSDADHDGDHHGDCDIHVETIINCETQVGVTSLFRSVMIVAALSFHSLFEGMAIGLADTVTSILQLLFAIGIHKFVIAFAIGLEIYSESFIIKRVFIYMFVFSLGSPIGIMIAAIAKLQVTPQIDGVLNALATGSILYIVFFEVLPKERHSPHLSGHFQLIAVLCGFALMVGIQILVGHGH